MVTGKPAAAKTGVEETRVITRFLRDHPDERFRKPAELAKKFKLSGEFVEQVLSRLEPEPARRRGATLKIYGEIYSAKGKLRSLADEAVRHPTTFVVWTTIALAAFLPNIWIEWPQIRAKRKIAATAT